MKVCMFINHDPGTHCHCHWDVLDLFYGKVNIRRPCIEMGNLLKYYLKGKLTGMGQMDKILNVYINNPGHMTKMAAMARRHGKNPSKSSSSEPLVRFQRNLARDFCTRVLQYVLKA